MAMGKLGPRELGVCQKVTTLALAEKNCSQDYIRRIGMCCGLFPEMQRLRWIPAWLVLGLGFGIHK